MTVDRVPIPGGFLRDWCDGHAEGTEQPAEAFLASGLAILSAICGPRLLIRWSSTHTERANLWIMVAARSALGGKTTTSSALKWGINVATQVDGWPDEIRRMPLDRFSDADIIHDLDVLGQDQARVDAIEKKLAKAEGRDPEPKQPIDRAHPVAFVMVLNELAQLWGGDIPKHHDQARVTMLSIYDGFISSSTRATKVKPQDCFVSAIGNIPMTELAKRTEIATLRSGFAGRWFMLPMPDPVRHIATPRVDGDAHLLPVADQVRGLCALAETSGHKVSAIASMLPEGSDADAERDAWYTSARESFMRDLNQDELDEAGQEMFQRLQSTALKLAVYSAISRGAGTASHLEQVRIDATDIKWGQIIVDMSRETLLAAVRPNVGRVEDKIIAALMNGMDATSRERAVPVRDLRRKVARDMPAPDFLRVCQALVEVDEINMQEIPTGGRPSIVVWVGS